MKYIHVLQGKNIFGKTNSFEISNFFHPNAQSEVQTSVDIFKINPL